MAGLKAVFVVFAGAPPTTIMYKVSGKGAVSSACPSKGQGQL